MPLKKGQTVTRARTGCRTCRKRRKKCSEEKPMCKNCEKTNLLCEGYPERVRWKGGTPENKSDSMFVDQSEHHKLGSSSFEHVSESIGGLGDITAGYHGPMVNYADVSMVPQQATSGQFTQDTQAYCAPTTSFNDLQDNSSQMGSPSMFELSNNSLWSTVPDVSLPLRVKNSLVPEPHPLPSLLPGNHTLTEMRLFSHFMDATSQVLIASGPGADRLPSILLSLGWRDKVVLDSILCLSASHLLSKQGDNQEQHLLSEKTHLHDSVVVAQSRRMHAFGALETATLNPTPGLDINIPFATALLLYLYDICEGNTDWPAHLGMARKILEIPSKDLERGSNRALNIDPILLESFLFFDQMAAVTLLVKRADVDSVHNASSRTGAVFGVQDGLVDFAPQIAGLKMKADAGGSPDFWHVITMACTVRERLVQWRQSSPCSVDYTRMAELYKYAFFVWLFSILYPDSILDDKIKAIRLQMIPDILEVTDGMRAFLLFPLCVLGSIATEEADRREVRDQFEKLIQWSGFRSIVLWYWIVRRMWEDYDNGVPNSWDWIGQLRKHKMTLTFG